MQLQSIFCSIVLFFGLSHGAKNKKGGNQKGGKVVISITTTQFDQVVARPFFVDKTLLMKELIIGSGHNLITGPRGFGKSTNLNMVKTFLEIVVDEKGLPLDSTVRDENGRFSEKPKENSTKNFNLFRKYNLNIYHDKKFFYEHCGQHPVIFVDFKLMGGGTHKKVLENLKTIIHDAFKDHSYLLNCEELWYTNKKEEGKFDKQLFGKYLDDKKMYKLNKKELRDGLNFLSEILYQHFKKRSFLLVDECDAFIMSTIFETSFEMERTISFISKILSNLVKSKLVHGTLIVAGIRLVDALSNGNINSFYFLENHKFAEFFGFTENEVERLANKLNISFRFEEIKRRFGAYRVLETDLKIYCPSSVVSYLKNRKVQDTWMKYDIIPFLDNYIKRYKINSKMQILLRGETVRISAINSPDMKQIREVKEIIQSPLFFNDNEYNIALFFHFLCEIGYLNAVQRCRSYIDVVIPNAEVGFGLHWDFYTQSYFRKTYNLDTGKEINLFIRALARLGKTNDTFDELLTSLEGLYSDKVKLPRDDFEFREVIHFCIHQNQKFTVLDDGRFTGSKRLRHLVILRPDGSSIVMCVKHKFSSAYEQLEEILRKGYNEIIHNESNVRVTNYKILLGVYLDENRKVDISYLVNSTDAQEAISLKTSTDVSHF